MLSRLRNSVSLQLYIAITDVTIPKDEQWKPEYLASVGELLLDISVNLART